MQRGNKIVKREKPRSLSLLDFYTLSVYIRHTCVSSIHLILLACQAAAACLLACLKYILLHLGNVLQEHPNGFGVVIFGCQHEHERYEIWKALQQQINDRGFALLDRKR